jgi:hypothetical protein
MTIEESVTKKSKGHTIYKTKAGKRAVGVSTVVGVMDKSRALVPWANRLGLQGIDCAKYTDEMATIGTLAHYMIECWLTGQKCALEDYTSNQIEAAKKSFFKFSEWIKAKGLKLTDFAVSEGQLVSEKYEFGGTVDIMGMVNGVPTLIDIKTSKAVYSEHLTQVAGGYKILCDENGYGVKNVIILRVGRSEEEGFEERTVSEGEIGLHIKRFLICLDLYRINYQIGK